MKVQNVPRGVQEEGVKEQSVPRRVTEEGVRAKGPPGGYREWV